MDDIYQINLAKTVFREAYRSGDVASLLSIVHSKSFFDMSAGKPSAGGERARKALVEQATALFRDFSVKVDVIIIDIIVKGEVAWDFGWHEFTLTPKTGGEVQHRRERYFELWNKDDSGNWKISFLINNTDVREELNGSLSTWFKSATASV